MQQRLRTDGYRKRSGKDTARGSATSTDRRYRPVTIGKSIQSENMTLPTGLNALCGPGEIAGTTLLCRSDSDAIRIKRRRRRCRGLEKPFLVCDAILWPWVGLLFTSGRCPIAAKKIPTTIEKLCMKKTPTTVEKLCMSSKIVLRPPVGVLEQGSWIT